MFSTKLKEILLNSGAGKENWEKNLCLLHVERQMKDDKRLVLRIKHTWSNLKKD